MYFSNSSFGENLLAVLVTGGAGYIGSHFVKLLIQNGIECIVIDNLSRGHVECLNNSVAFENIDLLEYESLVSTLRSYEIDSVVHFAAFAYVHESVNKPQLYYQNNVVGSLNLLKAIYDVGVRKIIFSSTCSVYGNPRNLPVSEDEPVNPINPYAKTKLIIEQMLEDFDAAHGLKFVSLRYFNAAGADFSGEIGESHDPEPHLIPNVLFAALGKREFVNIYGNDYDTTDGTCVRDYIHVNDLAEAHLKALEYLNNFDKSEIINLGTGKGNSVSEVVATAKKITSGEIITKISGRRAGDPAVLIADNKKAKQLLDWSPRFDLEEIIESAWIWHKNQKY